MAMQPADIEALIKAALPDAQITKHVDHVSEVFVVSALVGRHRNRVCIFLDRRADDLGDAAVVTKMHDLSTVRLQQAPNHVDRSIVPVKQRSRGHKT